MILAKDNGSTDNITVVVVFLKPIEEIVQKISTQYQHLQETDEPDGAVDPSTPFTYLKNFADPQLYEGITSTSKFVTDGSMNGDSTIQGKFQILNLNGLKTISADGLRHTCFCSVVSLQIWDIFYMVQNILAYLLAGLLAYRKFPQWRPT